MKNKFIVILIFFLAFILRFWLLGSNPPSLDWDEASLGYNAYSILKTGRDEYGNFFPLSIKSFNDYKPPLYTYLSILPIAIFGLNEFSTRMVSAILGTFSVLIGFFLIKKIFRDKSNLFYYLFMFFFAISPWHIQFSRTAFESNISLFFILTGLWLFFKGLDTGYYLLLSFIFFAFSIYAYHSPRLVVPLLIIGMFCIYFPEIRQKKVWFLTGVITFLVLVLPIYSQLHGQTVARLGSVSVVNPDEKLGASIRDIEYDQSREDVLGKLVHNRRIIYAKEILGGYLDHFNFDFLFLTGDSPGRHHASGMGMLYLWDSLFIIIGIILYLNQLNRFQSIVIWWFLLAPAASSLASGTPHAVRALLMLPLFQVFAALGILGIFHYLTHRMNRKVKFSVLIIIFSLLMFNFYYYLHMYWWHTPKEFSQWWQYGYKELVTEVSKVESSYDKIVITYRYDQPYIYFLFYKPIDPLWYQEISEKGPIVRANRSFGKFEFRNLDWGKDSQLSNVLLVGTPDEIPQETSGIIKNIYFLDGKVAFRLVGR
ncbi:hypothetical protein A2960_00720 [Candidatus Gottesmanbacteria bacterium RIFCSPLOWO2_01_FULL_39_12b]|uniref:Glycosyltransferase RgtA/B/C/D-like domain-containing protein n=1 Tax=Candidatus Gottesmanbacteria bacterium RIFCSPLOWO2_01_FULL_39_12b TaxID=1798388 RepID=A0A1F6APS5_9BACT|nr:MAG: hypothetical protein A2960_00720 [Candidatus Gottesmanbacteria bacterium RIFCSPLOWO2_01_FULL_39_12b]